MSDCPFCQRIAAGDYDDRSADHDAVHFEPLNPVTPGHRLVVPVGHVMDALQDPYVTGSAMAYAARVAELLRLHPCNLITSAGGVATQTVYHLHIHIVPRRYGDGLALPWSEGREVVAAAVAAERERCALLLDRKRAVFCRPCDGEVCDYSDELAPASELIREGGDG